MGAAWAPLPPAGAPAIPVVAAGTGYLVVNDPGTAADNGLFPSAKVIGGYDFVGERWPNSPLDADGNAKMLAALKGTDKSDHLRVNVSGDVKGDTIKVTSVKLL